MPFMVWNDRIIVGIGAIDADHKQMIGMINELYDAIQGGSGHEKLDILFDRLLDYACRHFAIEEELFARTDYPGAAAHIRAHHEMTAWLKTARDQNCNRSMPAPLLNTMNQLKDYLFDHILDADQQYVPHMKAHNIH